MTDHVANIFLILDDKYQGLLGIRTHPSMGEPITSMSLVDYCYNSAILIRIH